MTDTYVRISCDIACDQAQPWYRLYVNDEMLIERTSPKDDSKYVQEIVTLKAVPGRYLLWCCGKNQTRINVRNITVLAGPAKTESDQYIWIE